MLELAQAYQRLGNVQGRTGTSNLGQLDDARRSYQNALDLYERLPASARVTPDLRRAVANVLMSRGRLEYNAYHEDVAETFTRRMLATLGDGSDQATRMLRAVGQRSLGDIRLRQGETAEALDLLGSAIRTLSELQASGFADASVPGEIANTKERLARARVAAGDLDSAVGVFEELLRTTSQCAGGEVTSAGCRSRAVDLSWLGDVYGATDRPNLNEPVKAAALYQQSIEISERLAAMDAKDRQARFDLAAKYGKLGDAVWSLDPPRALMLYAKALATASTLASKEQLDILHDLYTIAISRPLIKLGRTAEARNALLEALEAGKVDQQSQYADRVGELSIRNDLARLLIAENKPEAARRSLHDVIDKLEALRVGHHNDLTLIYYWPTAIARSRHHLRSGAPGRTSEERRRLALLAGDLVHQARTAERSGRRGRVALVTPQPAFRSRASAGFLEPPPSRLAGPLR